MHGSVRGTVTKMSLVCPDGHTHVYIVQEGRERQAIEVLMRQVRSGQVGRDAGTIIAAGLCGLI